MAKLTEQNIKHFLEKHSTTGEVIEKLAEYEMLEEQGLLLRLPCKVGDTVYAFLFTQDKPRYYECEVKHILIYEDSIEMCVLIKEEQLYARLDMAYIGKTVFLTKEEAEQKLASMQKGE